MHRNAAAHVLLNVCASLHWWATRACGQRGQQCADLLYWQVGERIRREVLGEARAESVNGCVDAVDTIGRPMD